MRPALAILLLVTAAASCSDDPAPPTVGARTDADTDGAVADVPVREGDGPGGERPGGPGVEAFCARQSCSGVISDLCCPSRCSGSDDIDCGGCGNRRVEPGETCDPLETCPSSCPPLGCQLRRLKSEGTCSAVCVNGETQTACKTGDGCCPGGCNQSNDRDCTAACGNGVLEQGELCDPLATCPQGCPAVGCTLRRLEGAGTCSARCVEAGEQDRCVHGDGCCPADCNATNDDDCGVVCGNGVKEGKETCDPLSTCPTVDGCKADGCRLRKLLNGGTCAAVCVDDGLQTACNDGDGCCPAGCHGRNDSDCAAVCGNGQVETGETCDPPARCLESAQACVSDNAIVRTRSGDPAACTFTCREQPRACGVKDGGCPAGCLASQDPDCAGCGNGVKEPNETCDPCDPADASACVSDANVTRVLTGSAATCDLLCTPVPRACAAGDGQCPAACSRAEDPDCRFPGGVACQVNVDCQSGRCADGRCCVDTCTTCQSCTGIGGTCVQIPRGQEDTVPAMTCAGGRVCNGAGVCLLPNGAACTTNDACSSSFCVQGICCDGACTAACRSCALTGSRGTCAPVSGTEDPDSCAFADQKTCNDTGVCVTPRCVLTPSVTAHEFGGINYGNSSAGKIFSFSNGCVGPLGPFSLSWSGANPSSFVVVSNGCTGTLAAGNSCNVSVAFRPAAAGALSARLSITTPDASTGITMSGTGTRGARLTFAPNPVAFGAVTPGFSRDRTITITNGGTGPTGTLSLSLPGALYPVWTVPSNMCTSLAVGASCTVTVRFSPSQYADYTATIAISSPGGSASAPMSGAGESIVK